MRLQITKSAHAESFYVVKSIYDKGKRSSKIVEKLGTLKDLSLLHDDPYSWAEEYVRSLNAQEVRQERSVVVERSQTKLIEKDKVRSLRCGYLFLQSLYHRLGLHKICSDICSRHRFDYDLDSVLSRLVYGRILEPVSKRGTFFFAKELLEEPCFMPQHIYRALGVIAGENDFIQAELYKRSLKLSKRNDRVLYYDCTNYFFETEHEDGVRRYGVSKEHRPSPIVGMGMFMDADGIPLAFSMYPGNENEQRTLKPLEKKILHDFSLSRFVVCTDAGLSSAENRRFNDIRGRAFITTQPIKKLKEYIMNWALNKSGWSLQYEDDVDKVFDIGEIERSDELSERYRDSIFFKERWIRENGLDQRIVVTFSLRYLYYQRDIRDRQADRARRLVEQNPSSIGKARQNDCKRFIKRTSTTDSGETASRDCYTLNEEAIESEERFDGYYAVCTNLEDDASEIAKVNKNRWQIEECFRILKTEFRARPVFLSREDRITAHFVTCFIALVLYRYLEKELGGKYTCEEIIGAMRGMKMLKEKGEGFVPTYTRTEITDALHEAFGFRTDYEITSKKKMREIIKQTKQ